LGLKTPVVATVINHPVSLGIQRGGENHTGITGTSYSIDPGMELGFYRTLFPHLSRSGMIYDIRNPAGYLAEEPMMEAACEKQGIRFISVGVEKKEGLASAAKELIARKVDIIIIPTNRLVYANLGIFLPVTNSHKVPVVSMNKQGVEYGALAALYADTYKLARLAVPILIQILEEKRVPSNIPFVFIKKPDVIINLSAAKRLNYEFPAEIIEKASIILR